MVANLRLPFDVDDGKDAGVFVSAIRQHGKTKLAQLLADLYIDDDCLVRVFDTSQAWNSSNIPTKVTLRQPHKIVYPSDQSIIFDISRLYLQQQRFTIQTILGTDFQTRVESPNPKLEQWIIYFFEEAQIILPNGSLRANYAQEAFRTISVGANYNLGYMLITQRPADVSTKAISRCGILYLGKHFESNDITKLKKFLGWRKYNDTHERLSSLKKREFYHFDGNKATKFRAPTYRQYRQPTEFNRPSRIRGFWGNIWYHIKDF